MSTWRESSDRRGDPGREPRGGNPEPGREPSRGATEPADAAGRRYPRPASAAKERRDIYATVFALGLGLLLLVNYAIRPLMGAQDGVPGKVARIAGNASVDNGRAVARELISDGAANLLWSAHWTSVALLLLVLVSAAVLCRNFLRGDFFTLSSYRWVTAMSWLLLAYLFVPGFLGMLGGNMVLRDVGLRWLSVPAVDINDFIVMYVLVMTLSLVAVAIRRAATLERDTEGLV